LNPQDTSCLTGQGHASTETLRKISRHLDHLGIALGQDALFDEEVVPAQIYGTRDASEINSGTRKSKWI